MLDFEDVRKFTLDNEHRIKPLVQDLIAGSARVKALLDQKVRLSKQAIANIIADSFHIDNLFSHTYLAPAEQYFAMKSILATASDAASHRAPSSTTTSSSRK